MLDREAFNHQRSDSKRRRPDIEAHTASRGESVSKSPQEAGIYGQRDISGPVHYGRDEFKVEIHSARAADCDR